MQTKRIPLKILVGLGLASAPACGVSACLSVDPTDELESESDTTSDVGVTSTTAGTGATADITTGPCLGPPMPTEVTTGPCLGQLPTTGTGEMTGSTGGSSGTTSGDGDGDGDGDGETTGDGDACLDGDGSFDAEPLVGTGQNPDGDALRSALIDRVLSTSVLPDDVKARLRARMYANIANTPEPDDNG